MVSLSLLPYLSTLLLLTTSILAECPLTPPANPIPGCWGEPGCAYVVASDLGPGAACKFDYCNCGGVNVPLLPTMIGSTTTVGCGAYTSVPTTNNCPTAPASPGGSNGSGGNGGSSGGGASLPNPVTTGGPISTAEDAFATTASSVTTLLYQGGALTYTRATFTSLSAEALTTTITATVTKTASTGGAVATYVGPIVVGPQGIFWGPPGTAPNCVWPFCTGSGPPASGSGGGGDANGGGGVGGNFGCQDCLGGGGTNGQGGGSGEIGGNGGGSNGGAGNGGGSNGGGGNGDGGNGGGGNGGGGNGGGGNGGGGNNGGGNGGGGNNGGGNGGGGNGDGDGGGNGEPPPEACPGAKRIKRSESSTSISTSTSGRLVRRAEEQIVSTNPLKDALNNFGKDKQGGNLASAAIDSAERILLNKLPKDKENAYVTGLEGHYKLTQETVLGTGSNEQTFPSGTNLYWKVRWDWDSVKGPHVNAQFGTRPSVKFAYNLDPSRFTNGGSGKTMEGIVQELNKQCKYSMANNLGKDQPTWDTTVEQAKDDLKNYFKSVANGPC